MITIKLNVEDAALIGSALVDGIEILEGDIKARPESTILPAIKADYQRVLELVSRAIYEGSV